MTIDHMFYAKKVSRIGGPWPLRLSLLGVGGLLLAGLLSLVDGNSSARLSHAYLLNFSFFLSVSLGSLFFVMLQHLTGARWSVVVRRIAEILASPLPVLGLLSLPIVIPLLFGSSALYTWNDQAVRASDLLIQGKSGYLNAPFFMIRCLGYFLVWGLLCRVFVGYSIAQDKTSDPEISGRLRQLSGPSMIAFALTVNFAAFDLLMSLDAHWFSTIFGLYFFAGCTVSVFAALPLAVVGFQYFGLLKGEVSTEHLHDLAKLLFGFVFFWAYIAFSQYILIWYANIPEETMWYLVRQENGWLYISLLLIVGHFMLPFFGLMSRSSRRSRHVLVGWCVFLLAMQWVDLLWLVMPSFSTTFVPVGVVELFCFLGVGSIWLSCVLKLAANTHLVPTGDPHLSESLSFHNA
ncbi:MAG: quinol:cytochrome C oxidoreductase [Planctomycetaceae bacterium]|nr:quinol:cytochrome C oxidoreductase [Planctomycetaceae bacterium]